MKSDKTKYFKRINRIVNREVNHFYQSTNNFLLFSIKKPVKCVIQSFLLHTLSLYINTFVIFTVRNLVFIKINNYVIQTSKRIILDW